MGFFYLSLKVLNAISRTEVFWGRNQNKVKKVMIVLQQKQELLK